MENKIYIIGCGGHARGVADVILDNDPTAKLVFVDRNAREMETIFGFPVIKSLPATAENVFIALGDNALRQDLARNQKLISVISKRAYISPQAHISDGVFIADGVHIGPCANIGKGTIINTNAVVEHEAEIGDFTHISVNSTICGRAKIGSNVFIGAGATVIDKISVCSNVTIGAGGVVVKNIDVSGTYIGIPARILKDNRK